MPAAVGMRFGRYELLQKLGAGGMGEVYRARDRDLGRDVAVKFLSERFAGDTDRLARFAKEARAASSLNHPNIVTIHEIGSANGLPFIVMELVEGKTLRNILLAERLSTRRVLDVAAQAFSMSTPRPSRRRHGRGNSCARLSCGRSPLDSCFTTAIRSSVAFRRSVQTFGLASVRTAPRSPWQNPYIERVIGSIRRECLDHVIVVNERHLRRLMQAYLTYCHALGKDTPDARPPEPKSTGPIVALPEVGGLHHRYERRARPALTRFRPAIDHE